MTPMPFLIIETGQPVASMRRHGSFAHWIRVAAGLDRDATVVVDVEHGHDLPSREGFAGAIVTGSAAMVPDRHPWSERTADWLRDAAHAGLPLFGICYGHQLIAHALGGEVGPNEVGREMGTVRIHLHPAAQGDPLFAGLDDPFAARATHLQSVLRPPEGAEVRPHNAREPCPACRGGGGAWGVRFQPESSPGHTRGYTRVRHDALAREQRCGKQLASEVHAAPQARKILRRFIAYARRPRHAPVS